MFDDLARLVRRAALVAKRLLATPAGRAVAILAAIALVLARR